MIGKTGSTATMNLKILAWSRTANYNGYDPSKRYKRDDGSMLEAEADVCGEHVNVHKRNQGPFKLHVIPREAYAMTYYRPGN